MRETLVLDGGPSLRQSRHRNPLRDTASVCDTVSEPEIRVQSNDEPAPIRVQRVEAYDWIRFLAAINVIVFHVTATQTGVIGRGGVPAFLMIAGSLPAMRFQKDSLRIFMGRRARRILVPWLFWSALFGAAAGVRYLRHGLVPDWTIHNLLIGTSTHLWFFPAIFAGTLLVWMLLRLIGSWKGDSAFLVLVAAAVALFAMHAWTTKALVLAAPYGPWVFGAPALILGIAFGLAYRERVPGRRRLLVLGVCVATMFGAILHGAIGDTGSGISYLVAGLSLPAALLLPIRSNALLHNFTHVSLGVYASHPLVYLGLQSFLGARLISAWLAVPAVFIGAVAFSTLLRKVPWGKTIV